MAGRAGWAVTLAVARVCGHHPALLRGHSVSHRLLRTSSSALLSLFVVRRSFGCALCSVVQEAKPYRSALPRTADHRFFRRHLLQRSAVVLPKLVPSVPVSSATHGPHRCAHSLRQMARHCSCAWLRPQHSGPCSSANAAGSSASAAQPGVDLPLVLDEI
ncbi:hypothetical protein L1887_55159 [Cichorium endivia]|nr:hypothetical protein L1887_55159 [Cichorium endivia]